MESFKRVRGEWDNIKKEFVWILIPFVYGYLSSVFLIVMPLISQIVFGVFWFWVGTRYAKLKGSDIKNILIGNSIWLVSFLIYIWQFVLLNDESRNLFFAGISQSYPFSFLWSGKQLSLIFTNILGGTIIIIISYLVMLFVFIVGYFTKRNGS